MMELNTRLVCVLLIFTAALPAQLPAGQAQLERAIVVEEQEHDLRDAERLYREVAEEHAFADAVRARAWLRLGELFLRLERPDEAREALHAAAQRDASVGAEVARLLQDRGAEQERRRQLAERARAELEKDSIDEEALIWIGEPAVPVLLSEIERRRDAGGDWWDYGPLASIVWRIGGEAAEEALRSFVRHPDASFRAAIAASLGASGFSEPLATIGSAFLSDEDEDVRSNALGTLWTSVPASRIVALVGDPNEDIREQALGNLEHWGQLRHEPDVAATIHALIGPLEAALYDVDPQVGRQAQLRLGQTGILQSSEGRSFFLRVLPDLSEPYSGYPNRLPSGRNSFGGHADEVLAAARRMEPLRPKSSGLQQGRQETLLQFLGGVIHTWEPGAMAIALELARLGYDLRGTIGRWIATHGGTSGNAGAVAESIEYLLPAPPDSRDEINRVLAWLAESNLSPESWPYLRAVYERWKAEPPRKSESESRSDLNNLLRAAGRTGSEEIIAYFLRQLDEAPEGSEADLHSSVSWAFILASRVKDSEAVRTGLRRLLVRDVAHGSSRALVGLQLVHLGDAPAIDLFGRAYELGMRTVYWRDPLPPVDVSFRSREGYQRVLRAMVPLGRNAELVHGYDADEQARIWDVCLSSWEASAWEDAVAALVEGTANRFVIGSNGAAAPQVIESSRADMLPEEVIEVLCRKVAEAPDSLGRDAGWIRLELMNLLLALPHLSAGNGRVTSPGIDELHLRALEMSEPEYLTVALWRVRDTANPDIVQAVRKLTSHADPSISLEAMRALVRCGDPWVAGVLSNLVDDERAWVRLWIVGALMDLEGSEALPRMERFSKDEDAAVRGEVCRKLGQATLVESVPILIPLLQDPHASVREAAQEALSTIRFYHEEKAHWERVFQGNAIGANSAAEALLEQAAPDQDKEVRLMAIRSLGTLGVPEVLPFLIRYGQEDDPEIAAAAKAAVKAINDRGGG